MTWTRPFPIAAFIFAATCSPMAAQDNGKKIDGPSRPGMTLTTPAFADGSEIPSRYTGSDPNPVSPELKWDNVPSDTISFVLIMHDPDVSKQRTTEDQLHWLLINVPGTTRELPEGVPHSVELADGSTQGKNGAGMIGYRGPGAGAAGPYHHYTFELFALDAKLDLSGEPTREHVRNAMEGHILAKAVLVGRFHR